ncbi:MAG: HdeD family acid-resistance protein, partial [Mycolicibacterium sp.]|nr:HdeD family acid-resistance protein [Mycolicibacterium sp.]
MVQRLWISTILFGLLAVILGVVILVWPGPSLTVAAVLFGVYLVVSGVALVFMAFSLPVSGGSRFLYFISGVASVILGILAFRHFGEGYAVLLLAIWIGIGFIFRGVSAVAAAVSEPGLPGRGWAIFFGVISIIAGIVVLAYPFDSIVTLTFVVGIWMIIVGVMEIISGLGMRSDAKKAEK